ncbi:PhnA domain-containing protein [Sulfurimonas sp. SAG-AH-194-C21]|nr:alkylphosphonate utilization protein [Sulfurimonas sp. SAG-AH-194-C21]MDF1883191.1 PhnA domain-containing protein [Sulfurimonas sp. SAG-AH-194-C21]
MANRSNICELCSSEIDVALVELPISDSSEEQSVYLCSNCNTQIESEDLDENHFNCLNDAMWSEIPAAKIMSYILWNRLGRQDMVEMMYLEEDELKLAEQAVNAEANKLVYRDANGVELKTGDSIVILKDLEVKGAGFTAKRGTTVTRIGLAPGDAGHVEGRVNGTKIFIKTEFIKKA